MNDTFFTEFIILTGVVGAILAFLIINVGVKNKILFFIF